MENVYVVSGVRTAIGKFGGTLKDVLPEELARIVIEGAIEKAGIDKSAIDEVIFGQTKQSADAPNIARVAALMAKLPEEMPAYTVHRQCGSGLTALIAGATQIKAGESDVVVVGGVESMSGAQYYLRNARYGYKVGNAELVDPNTESQPKSQPEDVYGHLIMGMTAENLAEKFSITREEQDAFALQSQQRACAAISSGRFKDEIVPVVIPQRKKDPIVFDTDEFPRFDTSAEKLAKLKPAFKKDGTVTAGNASGRNDGASALVLASEKAVKKYGLKPLARYVSYAAAGVDPRLMGYGPVPAMRKALEKAGLTLADMDLIEINEAFAAQTLACVKELGIDQSKLNVNGGAIALGHPLGMSGARISVTLVHEMLKRGSKYGIAAICIAGGQGAAAIFERV